MAGKQSSSSIAVFLVDGYDVLKAALQGMTFKAQAMTERVTGLGDTWERNSPTGLSMATFTQVGAFFDDTANGLHDALKASTDVLRIAAWALTGNTVGARFFGMQGAYGSQYAVVGKVGSLTKADVTYTVSGQLDRGVILMNSAAQTVTWTGAAVDYTLDTAQRAIPITANTIANPTVVTTPVPHGLTTGQVILISGVATSSPTINGSQTVTVLTSTTFSVPVNVTIGGTGGSFVAASTVGGGVGYQAISAYAGLTGVVVKIQHSADNATWVDLITFANVTGAPVAERLTVAGTVNRYTRHVGTVTGTGSITPFVGFSRS